MWRYAHNLRELYQTPVYPQDDDSGPDRARAQEIISSVQASGWTLLTESETKQLRETYGIPTVPTRIAASEDEAVEVAEKTGYPVVLKIHCETITHKTDVGGVRLNLRDEVAVREAYQGIATEVGEQADTEAFMGVSVQPMVELERYELIVGSSFDSQFGPVMLFGSGGELAARGGHIPGAVNLPWLEVLTGGDVVYTIEPDWRAELEDPDVERFKPPEEIQQILDELGITRDKTIITYCQTLWRGAHAYFMLRLMGHEDVAGYDGFWAEWGNRTDLPVVSGASSWGRIKPDYSPL